VQPDGEGGRTGVDHRRVGGRLLRRVHDATYVHANPEDLATARDALAAIYRAEET